MSDNIHHSISFTKPSSAPLPTLLADSIRRAIRDGKLKPGDQLPSEPQFAEQLGVSRTTLRDAVRILLSDGVLERRHGVGTFVASNPLINIQEGLESLISLTDVIRKQGYEPGTSESRWEIVPADERLAEILGLSIGTPVLHLSRTRTANGVPVIHCEEFLPASLLPPEGLDRLTGDWSLYKLLNEHQPNVVSAVCKIVSVIADQALAARLKVPLNYPLLLLRQTHFSGDHRPVLYCENFHNSSVIEFHVLRR